MANSIPGDSLMGFELDFDGCDGCAKCYALSNEPRPDGCGHCEMCRGVWESKMCQRLALHQPCEPISCPSTGAITISSQGFLTPESLASCFSHLFPTNENGGGGLEPVQKAALERWHTWHRNIGRKIVAQDFSLTYVAQIFGDYYYRRALRKYITIEWVEGVQWLGRTGTILDGKGGIRISIQIQKPSPLTPGDVWTERTVQNLLGTLIHELAHAVFRLYGCICLSCMCLFNRINGIGVTGHGDSWIELAQAMEDGANQYLLGFHQPWKVLGTSSLTFEQVSVRELHESQDIEGIGKRIPAPWFD